MIDVMKRLAELDAQNPNIIKEHTEQSVAEGAMDELDDDLETMSDEEFEQEHGMTKAEAKAKHTSAAEPIAECDMMPGASNAEYGGANISITAASGPELSGMLKDIMSLAGLSKVEPEHMPVAHEPSMMTQTPIMRSVMDKLNFDEPESDEVEFDDGDDEETDEAWDNTPADPTQPPAFKPNEFAKQQNTPGVGDRMDGTAPKAYPGKPRTMEQIESKLFAEYQEFINEGTGDRTVSVNETDDGAMKDAVAELKFMMSHGHDLATAAAKVAARYQVDKSQLMAACGEQAD